MAQKAGYQGIKKLTPPLDITSEGTQFIHVAQSLDDPDNDSLIPLSIGKMLSSQIGLAMDSIAPMETGDQFSNPYNIGDEFYLSDGKLYKATKQIAADDNIIIYPTDNYNCQLAGSVSEQLNQKMSYADNGVLGASNMLNFDAWKTVGLTKATAVWGDDSLTLTATENNGRTLLTLPNDAKIKVFAGEKVKFIWTDGGSGSSARFDICNASDTSNPIATASCTDGILNVTVPSGCTELVYRVWVSTSGQQAKISNLMCLLQTDTNTVACKYSKTNIQLTTDKCETTVIGNTEDGAICQKSGGYSANDLFIRNGKIGKATTSISQGDTFTLNTNYVETTIGELITAILNS